LIAAGEGPYNALCSDVLAAAEGTMAETLDDVLALADDPGVRRTLTDLLLDILRVDTAVGPDLGKVGACEQQVFDRIAQAVRLIRGSDDGVERVPIDPAIEGDPYYTPTHYTAAEEGDLPLRAAETYAGRSNLVLRVAGQGSGTLAFNAHVDVVSPYIPPSVADGLVRGRGACDDKGQVAAMVLALGLIEEARRRCGIEPAADLLFEFVIDEEPGGNGSLSLALDRRFACDAMVVLEATSLKVHPANRGAVWYRLEVEWRRLPEVDPVGLAAECVLALEAEGAAIKAESDHRLFPHRPVQTCHGIFGPWGEHPSTVNDHVRLIVWLVAATESDEYLSDRVTAIVRDAVDAYCEAYGDRLRDTGLGADAPRVGVYEPEPPECYVEMVADRWQFVYCSGGGEEAATRIGRHCDLEVGGGFAFLAIYGKGGHMGAAEQCDNAIIKLAYIVEAFEEATDLGQLFFSVEKESTVSGAYSAPLALGGGQGFLPTHRLEEVTERMRRAVATAVRAYCEAHGVAYDPKLATMTFDKLHNDAFACDPGHPAVRAFVEVVRATGVAVEEPLRGWDVSCDARIFAREYPDAAVITFGAGTLAHAHSADEQVRLDDIATVAKAIARFALTYDPSGAGERTRS